MNLDATEVRRRHFLDLFSNPAWNEIEKMLEEEERGQNARLQNVSMEGELHKVNAQAGLVRGVQTIRTRLNELKEEVHDIGQDAAD